MSQASVLATDLTAQRLTDSATAPGSVLSTADCLAWLASQREEKMFRVERVPFDRLAGWHFAEETGNLVHRTGRFFTVEGLRVRLRPHRTPEWNQPIIVQTEIGILGILVKEIDGVLHCLMQAKMEPGNRNLVQLSPTVQATRSNYVRVHQGNAIPYLDYFLAPRRGRVLVDSLQSEQGAWFLHKRNRNIVVETDEEVELLPDFCWVSVGQIQQLLQVDEAVNMDARTVLSIMPFVAPATSAGDAFTESLRRSLDPDAPTVVSTMDAISWVTENKARYDLTQQLIPLAKTSGWTRGVDAVEHCDGDFFSVVGVDVRAENREVSAWMQPLLLPAAPGLVVFLTRRFGGVLHVLLQARPAAGALDIVEVAPTVHCTPRNYRDLPPADRPPYLDYAREVDPSRVRYECWLSEEGGRFLNATNQYQVIEVGDDFPVAVPAGFLWLSVYQLMTLLRFGNCVNVEARSLLACLHSLW